MTLRTLALPLFALAAASVYAVAWWIAGGLASSPSPTLLATGLAADVVVLVPLLYYGLVVRGRGVSPVSVAPVVILSLVGAHWILPEAYEGVLGVFEVGVVLVEAAVLTWVVLRFRAVVRAYRRSGEADLLVRLREAFGAALGAGLAAEAFAAEAAVPLYALGRGVELRGGSAFPYRTRSGYGAVFAGIAVAALVELALGHFLLLRFVGASAAWVHFAVSAYGALWLTADLRAMHARPVRLTGERLLVRCGLRWTADVPLALVSEVRRLEKGRYAKTDGFLDLTPLGAARYAVVLREPVRVRGPLGITREATRLGLDVDDRERFEARLAETVGAA